MNNKVIIALVMVLGLCCSQALAQEREKKESTAISEWLKSLQTRIAQMVPKKTLTTTNMVAGTRGAKEDIKTELYWKGKKGEEPVTEEELAGFKQGLDSAARGESLAAIKELEKFMAIYPDSPLIPDAKKTLDLVKAEPKVEERVEPKQVVKDGTK